jgi:hypothetical protein
MPALHPQSGETASESFSICMLDSKISGIALRNWRRFDTTAVDRCDDAGRPSVCVALHRRVIDLVDAGHLDRLAVYVILLARKMQ